MKVGICLSDLSNTQKAFMAISHCNTLIHNKIYQNLVLFFCTTTQHVIKSLCMSTTIDKIFAFDGLLIATCEHTASLFRRVKARKVFYIWDLFWLRGSGNYLANCDLLQDETISLACRSESHADCVENYCGRRPEVIPNFNLKMIIEKFDVKS